MPPAKSPRPGKAPQAPTAPSPDDIPAWVSAGSTGEAMLRMAAVHSACIALSDAAQHLRRTAILAEAAGTSALVRSLQAGAGDDDWMRTLEGAERTMQAAVKTFTETGRAAMALVAEASRTD